MIKKCIRCLVEKPIEAFSRNGKYRKNICNECYYKMEKERRKKPEYREYMRTFRKQKKQEQKKRILDYFGGKCKHCGLIDIPDVYDIHHVIPDDKDFQIGTNMGSNWERIKTELAKCIMLCANCHRRLHAELRNS